MVAFERSVFAVFLEAVCLGLGLGNMTTTAPRLCWSTIFGTSCGMMAV